MRSTNILLFFLLILILFVIFSYKEKFIDSDITVNMSVKIDTIFPRPREKSGEVIIFRKGKWLLWNSMKHTTSLGPYGIVHHDWFKDFPKEFQEGVDCIVQRPTDPNRELIVFKDGKWILWDFSIDSLTSGPHNIGQHPWFNKLPDIFHNGIDCSILNPRSPNSSLIFFKGSSYIFWDFKKNIPIGPLGTLGKNIIFKNLPGLFKNSIDAMVPYNKNLVIFKNDKWILWDFANSKLISGPNKILQHPWFKNLGVHFIESKDDAGAQSYITLDKSGSGNHGILHNIDHVSSLDEKVDTNKCGVEGTFSTNPFDMYKAPKGLKFNGKSSYMEMKDIKDLYKNGFTFSCLFKPSIFYQVPEKKYVLAHCRGDIEWELAILKNRFLGFSVRDKVSGFWSTVHNKNRIVNNWYHVAISQDNTNQILHVNEIEVQKKHLVSGFPKNISEIIIGTGGYKPNFENYYEGVIGNIKIYNRVLSRKEVCDLSQKCPKIEEIDKDKQVIKNNIQNINSCSFAPKGLREIDCVKLCHSEKNMNSCKIEECLDLCSGCKDEIDCKWLVPPTIVKAVQKVDPGKQDKCQFNPFGKNITHCTNVCNSSEKVNWGGDSCTEKSCNLLCSGCENTDVCQWLETPKEDNTFPPDVPSLDGVSGNKQAILYWERPYDGSLPIKKYVIIGYKTNTPDKGINIEIPPDPKCQSCSYVVKNLENDVYYSFGVSAVNSKGMSKLSNIVTIIPENIDLPYKETIKNKEPVKTVIDSVKENDELKKDIVNAVILDDDTILKTSSEDILEDNDFSKNMNKKIDTVYSANGSVTDNILKQLFGKTLDITI